MELVKRIHELDVKTIEEPNKRNLQLIYTPQLDEGMKDFTFLISTLYPINGQTDYHVHPVDEMIMICSGYGELIVEGETYTLEPGTVLYAPAGKQHQCKNYSSETMQMACYYIPALPNIDSIKGDIKIKK